LPDYLQEAVVKKIAIELIFEYIYMYCISTDLGPATGSESRLARPVSRYAVSCSVVQCVAAVAECCSVLQFVAVCCSVLSPQSQSLGRYAVC